jgi:hypothetical protein
MFARASFSDSPSDPHPGSPGTDTLKHLPLCWSTTRYPRHPTYANAPRACNAGTVPTTVAARSALPADAAGAVQSPVIPNRKHDESPAITAPTPEPRL